MTRVSGVVVVTGAMVVVVSGDVLSGSPITAGSARTSNALSFGFCFPGSGSNEMKIAEDGLRMVNVSTWAVAQPTLATMSKTGTSICPLRTMENCR
jgi:hypothetical protein